MRSDDLTRAQLDRLQAKLGPTLGYLSKLCRRMDAEAFPLDDPLRKRVEAARDAMQSLKMEIHYLGCDGQVGKPPRWPGKGNPRKP